MKRVLCHPSSPRRGAFAKGFSLVEVLLVIVLSAATLTVAVMAYQTLASSRGHRSNYGTVLVGEALSNFYGHNSTSIDAYFAPNFGRVAQAELLRDRLHQDLERAVAVYALARNGLNTVRPSSLAVSSDFEGRLIDTPEAFRQLLAEVEPSSATIFTSYRGASNADHASLFILRPSPSSSELSVLSVFEVDLLPATSNGNAGTYASVRRYEDNKLTDYYDIFYPASTGTIPFKPLVVSFEQSTRNAVIEGDPVDRVKLAAERPFYFLWWPNPAAPTLEAFTQPSYNAEDPRASYPAMGGRTPFFFVVPMFPAL